MTTVKAPPLMRRLARWLDRRRGGRGLRPQCAQQGVPRPLVVHARRARPLLLHHPHPHGRLPHLLLPSQPDRGRVPGQLRADARRASVRGVPVRTRAQLRRARRARDAADPPLGRVAVQRGDRRPPRSRLLHGRVPPSSRDQLDDRCDAADPRGVQRVRRVTRCSTTSCPARGCASRTRSPCRFRSSARGSRRCCSVASSPDRTSSSGCTSSTSCCCRR